MTLSDKIAALFYSNFKNAKGTVSFLYMQKSERQWRHKKTEHVYKKSANVSFGSFNPLRWSFYFCKFTFFAVWRAPLLFITYFPEDPFKNHVLDTPDDLILQNNCVSLLLEEWHQIIGSSVYDQRLRQQNDWKIPFKRWPGDKFGQGGNWLRLGNLKMAQWTKLEKFSH